ncbi:hypothetical protein Tco_0967393 [Tanacetum coccineum]
MECGMTAHLMTIVEKFNLHEEFHEVDHHESASWSIEVDTGESAISTALGVVATRAGETTLGGGSKYSSNIGWNK